MCSPLPLQAGTLVCGEDGQGGHKRKGESLTVFDITLRTLEEFKNIEGILIHCLGGTCERA